MSGIVLTDDLAGFLDRLKAAEATDYLRAPGIGLYRADEIRRGMVAGAIQIHHLGVGLVFTSEEAVANGRRVWKPTQALLNWEAWMAAKEEHDRPASSDAAKKLLATFRGKFALRESVPAGVDRWSLD